MNRAGQLVAVLLVALAPLRICAAAALEAPDPPEAPHEVLTLDEAAALLRVAPEALRAEADAGRVPARRIGSEWRFARTALLAWLGGSAPVESESIPEAGLASLSGRGDEGDTLPESIGEAPEVERADEIFLRDQQLLLSRGDLVVEPAGFYTRSDSRDLALVLGGLSSTDVLDIEERIATARLTARYGLLDETELIAELTREREDRTAQLTLSDVEVNDKDDLAAVWLGLRRTLVHERPGVPNLVLSLGGYVPIENTSPGFTTGISAVSSFDPAILFGGVQYERTFARDFDDLSLVEHDHNISATLGLAFALNDELTLSAAVSGVYSSETTFHPRRNVEFVLDSEDDYYLRLAMTRMLSPGRYVEPAVTFLLNGDESQVMLGLSFPFLIKRGDSE